MVALALVDDIEDAGRVEMFGPVKEGRKVGRRVIGRAVGLADDERLGLEARMLGMKHDQGAPSLSTASPAPASSR